MKSKDRGDEQQTFRRRVLFVCIHNAARSQMAEAFLNRLGKPYFEAESAGLEPGAINPLAIEVMAELGIDISGAKSKAVFDLFKQGKKYSYVITVCDEASQQCPIFPGPVRRIHWNLEDPAIFEGSREKKLEMTRRVRDEIKEKVEEFVREFKSRIGSE